MQVVKRDGRTEPVRFDKITRRLEALKSDKALGVLNADVVPVAAGVCSSLRDGIDTATIDELTAGVAASLSTENPAYGVLAARILVSNLQKSTSDSLLVTYRKMADILSPEFLACARRNAKDLQSIVDYARDFDFDYTAFKTLERIYLARVGGVVVERPQHMWMRVALALWGDDLDRVRETYDLLSTKKFTHASPTLFNAGMRCQQLASCFLQGVEEDSIEGIFEAVTKCAKISKFGGGIGMHVSGVRARGSRIAGTNGTSDGLVPMLRVVNSVATYVNQGGKRKGAIAVYIEPHHADVLDVLALKRNSGDEHLRARDLFYAVWVSDLFMRRVEANAEWSLFDPATAPGLDDVHGDAYVELYERYEAEGRAVAKVPAQTVWFEILRSQIETGTPYILFKDAANAKSNQQNLGTIKCSNLCVSGDTRILTSTGYHPIAELVDRRVEVWNGERFSETTVRQTGTAQKLVTVAFDNGAELRCTPYHKFYVEASPQVTTVVRAADLRPGDCLVEFDLPTIVTGKSERHPHQAYAHGMACADGSADELGVPINSSPDNKLRWLEGYVDGHADRDGAATREFQLRHASKDFLRDVQLMLHTLGVHSTIARDADAWRIDLGSRGPRALTAMGFDASTARPVGQDFRVRVASVTDRGDVGDTYCFNEPLRHAGVFEGVLTGQCSEIIEFTSKDEVAVCTLASMNLPAFVRDGGFDFEAFMAAVRVAARNLDRVIDINAYPVPEARASNERHRPVGLGVQGLQDVFFLLRLPFDSPEAADLNVRIFAAMYYAALDASCALAETLGPYPTFAGSPASQGRLQFDLWGADPRPEHDWAGLKARIAAHGLRNSLSVAPMPTASTANILGNYESTEPAQSNMFSRRTLAGEFAVVNKHLVRDLAERGLWTPDVKNEIVSRDGSVQGIPSVPDDLKKLYRTVWELSMKTLIDLAADRGPYVCQSQSMNLFVAEPTFKKLSSMHHYAWKRGLKTGVYYLRSKPAAKAVQITVDPCISCSA